MDRDVEGVRISPGAIDFLDTEPGILHQVEITVLNISGITKDIRIYPPKLKKFHLRVKNNDRLIAPGLCMKGILEYTTETEDEDRTTVVVTVSGKVVEIPVCAIPAQPSLEIERSVNFGTVGNNTKVIYQYISLVNHGLRPGAFKLEYNGNMPITIIPTHGTVGPKGEERIKVEFMTKHTGKVDENVIVTLENREPTSFRVKVNIVQKCLELLDPEQHELLECIKFGPAYYGTDRSECAVLFNNGPDPVNFVAVLEDNTPAQVAGEDLTGSTMSFLTNQQSGKEQKGSLNVITSILTCIPNQGYLRPYEKMLLILRFSPRWYESRQGWQCLDVKPPRRDFAMFMKIKMVSARSSFEDTTNDTDVCLAVTGVALPVSISLEPAKLFSFGHCTVGERIDLICTVKNTSEFLPIIFKFHALAHFSVYPKEGRIKSKGHIEAIFTFTPKQFGSFKQKLNVDFIGFIAHPDNFIQNLDAIISSDVIELTGYSDPYTTVPPPKFNMGITPLITNEVGINITTMTDELRDNIPNQAVISEHKSLRHALANKNDNNALVAFPNDRAGSLHPSKRDDIYKTIFTKTERYTYTDPDYAFTDEEERQRQANRQIYLDLIKKWNKARMEYIRNKKFSICFNEVDLGFQPAEGLKQTKIRPMPGDDIIVPIPPNAEWQPLSNKNLIIKEKETLQKRAKEGLNAIPTSRKEKIDCSRILSPQELHQVIVGPPVINFGRVCLRSITTLKIKVVNNLDQYVHIMAEVDCKELRQSSPLSQVVPPMSKAYVPLIFESTTKGSFQRCVDYTVNACYSNHVTITADVVPVGLQLSTTDIVLKPHHGLPAEAGIRGIVTLKNVLNYPAEFTWSPNVGELGTAFSLRPASGLVEAHKDLDCEIVWHPSYLAPLDGSFSLLVHGGTTTQLNCTAQLGVAKVQFLERRVLFGLVPVNLTTIKKAYLHNSGDNHAYFQVMDSEPFPGLKIYPLSGVVPVGGFAELTVALTPDAILKFDTHIGVAIKGGHMVKLRMGGSVVEPSVDIDLAQFSFGGVCCSSGGTIPFKLHNKTVARTKLEFDLTRYSDFSLNFPGSQSSDDLAYQMLNPGMFIVTMEAEQIIDGEMIFAPTEVACYDFIMNITINDIHAPTPNPTPLPPSPKASRLNPLPHIITPRPRPPNIITPRRHVIATALRQPLLISTNKLHFLLPYDFCPLKMTYGIDNSQRLMLVNQREGDLYWKLDISKPSSILDSDIFKFIHTNGSPFFTRYTNDSGVEGELKFGEVEDITIAFTPKSPGHYECVLPIYIDNDNTRVYQYLNIIGDQLSPAVSFFPKTISLTPVPLGMPASADFEIIIAHYPQNGTLIFENPTVEYEDGTTDNPLQLDFPNGLDYKANMDLRSEPITLNGTVTFSSAMPVSFSTDVKFTDVYGNTHLLNVTATADNSILTCYPFLAGHRTDHQIICDQTTAIQRQGSKESVRLGEAIIQSCKAPSRNSRPGTSATSSTFQTTSSQDFTLTDSSAGTTPFSRDGAMNRPQPSSETSLKSYIKNRSLGSAVFPNENTEEGIFHIEVLIAVQKWFSTHGWPGGAFPIRIPETLRKCLSRIPPPDIEERAHKSGSWSINSPKKESRTIYDMISHLSGRAVPGIPVSNTLPTDEVERAKQIYWQHCSLLVFLKCQGAKVASIRPEYLLDPVSYRVWKLLQREVTIEQMQQEFLDPDTSQCLHLDILEDDLFEAVSKRAWTDLLLQILKCLVVAKITPKALKRNPLPDVPTQPHINPDPLSSNVYGVGERIILSWLNTNYKHHRRQIWKDCSKGGVPPSRWVVNFDYDLLDGLVIAAALGSYMPFLIDTHLKHMYTQPSTAEQCLHNALKVVSALQYAGIDYDVQAIDITDPNPISLLLLTAHLFHCLPHYLPKSSVSFVSPLHAVVTRQVQLQNSSHRPITYQILLTGPDAVEFTVPTGKTITIPARSSLNLAVEFKGRYMRPSNAVLILIGLRQGSTMASTMVFPLKTSIDSIKPKEIVKVECPCYHIMRVPLNVVNPFNEDADFKVILMESTSRDEGSPAELIKPKKKKRVKIRSKVDTGMRLPDSPDSMEELDLSQLPKSPEKIDEQCYVKAFYCSTKTVRISANDTVAVNVTYLPFHTGSRQCSVIFTNENVGEFLYSIEANAILPIPYALPFYKDKKAVRISSAAAAGAGQGYFGGDDHIIYWKCEAKQQLHEVLRVPVRNVVKDKALLLAAQQMMSPTEIRQRQLTQTLNSTAVCAHIIGKLAIEPDKLFDKSKASTNVKFKVKLTSSNYSTQDTVTVLHPDDAPDDGMLDLPITFFSDKSGHYPCQLILSAPDDIRVYKIETTVNADESNAQFEFIAPVNHSVCQNIPITNHSVVDWPMAASIEGDFAFTGPKSLFIRSGETVLCPVTFHPTFQADMESTLILENTDDHSNRKYQLKGVVETPLPTDHINLECLCNSTLVQPIKVPNISKHKLYFKVETDIPFMSGKPIVSVLPTAHTMYNMSVAGKRRGRFKGVVTFTACENPNKEVDSDDEDEVSLNEAAFQYNGYRVWFTVNIIVEPPLPEKTLNIDCVCHKAAIVEVAIKNPTNEPITFTVTKEGRDIFGSDWITLPPHGRDLYYLRYAPAVVGRFPGSLIFNNDSIGEFWYILNLSSSSPEPTTLPHQQSQLGKWIGQPITLTNPTAENLELVAVISNTNNFMLDRRNERPFSLPAKSQLTLSLRYTPSCIGNEQTTDITFHCEQLGEWVFHASGHGVLPTCEQPISVYSVTQAHSNLIIPFRNPMDHAAYVTVTLKDQDITMGQTDPKQSAFCLLLNHPHRHRLGPKSLLDIPVSFAPQEMRSFTGLVTVTIRREDGKVIEGYEGSSNPVSEIRWLFPINGIPELQPLNDTQAAVITCKARERVDERLEVILTGVPPTKSHDQKLMRRRLKTPPDQPRNEEKIMSEYIPMSEYDHSIEFSSPSCREDLHPAIAVNLHRTYRDNVTGLVALVFDVVYSPFKVMDYNVNLVIRAATGGQWRFPLRFTSTEPAVDDTIIIEAAGLDKQSSIAFRMNSNTSHPEVFEAYFLAGSDREFSVSPQSGELLPESSNGTLIHIDFIPTIYGKIHTAKLVIQTKDMQWSYDINGIVPDYTAPRGHSSKPMSGPHPDPRHRGRHISFVRENLKLHTTAVSSPIKGAPIVRRLRAMAM